MEIVLTGGPCAGKTSALRYLVEHLSARGWRALVVPEAATMLITGGVHDIGRLAVEDREAFLAVQRNLIGLQHGLRAQFARLAVDLSTRPTGCDTTCDTTCHETHHPEHKQIHDPHTCAGQARTVLIHDRAVLDNRAYMSGPEFEAVLADTLGVTPGEMAASYDAVVHLVTAADGAEAFYSTANNEARSETVEQAIALDKAVQSAWLGHPHLSVVGNDTDGFEKKLARTLAAVLNILGEPEPVEVERKWLLASPPPDGLLAGAVPVDIEQVYLPAEGAGERRVRARTHDGHTTYFHTTKEPTRNAAGRVEVESMISAESYRLLSGLRLAGTSVIRKRRYCFVHAGQHFELDHLLEPVDAWLLEAELVTAGDPVTLPEVLDVSGEVTADPMWRNRAIAAR